MAFLESKGKGLSIISGIGAISLSVMVIEISLTRIFSVKYDYHYTFLAISLAILGIGLGGVCCHFIAVKNSRSDGPMIWMGPICSLSISGFLLVISLSRGPSGLIAAIILAFFPFFSCGAILSHLFRAFPRESGRLYAYDLIGGSLGTLLVIPSLQIGATTSFLIGGISAFAGWALLRTELKGTGKWSLTFPISLLPFPLIVVHLLTGFPGEIPVDPLWEKEMTRILGIKDLEGKIIDRRWSHFGRTDLVAFDKLPDAMMLFIDGSAGTLMFRFNGDLRSEENKWIPYLKDNFSGSVPFAIAAPPDKKKVLIIGSGGGGDVLTAILGGAQKITAVEINGDMVSIVKKYSHYNGGIYNDLPGVEVIVSEGRNYLKRTEETFDIILLSLPITKSSRTPEAFALSENFLFTVESIGEYLDHLTERGQLAVVTHNERELIKLALLSLEAFKAKKISISQALKHIYTTGEGHLPLLVIQRSPIDPMRMNALRELVFRRGYPLHITYIPDLGYGLDQNPLKGSDSFGEIQPGRILSLLERGEVQLQKLIEALPFDCHPVRDANPFFFKMEKEIPSVLKFILFISLALGLGFFLLKGCSSLKGSNKRALPLLIFFASIGVGFMMVEIPLVQKFTLFLGHPVYSLCVILLSILLGAGLGSFTASRIGRWSSMRKLEISTWAVATLSLLHLFFFQEFFDLLMGYPLIARALSSVMVLFPLGFFLGIPFPMGIRVLHELNLEGEVPGAWGLNGIFSVTGSTLSIILSIQFGFYISIAVAVTIYTLIGMTARILCPKWSTSP